MTDTELIAELRQQLAEANAEIKRLQRVNQELINNSLEKERKCTCQLSACMD
jgi:hypothetical protein